MDGLYHVGIVVEDLDAAAVEMSGILGLTWAPQRLSEGRFRIGDRVEQFPLRYVTSRSGPPYLHMVEAVPNSPWPMPDTPMIDHLAFWVDDLADVSAALAGSGAPPIIMRDAVGAGPLGMVYHRSRTGIRIEIVDVVRRSDFEGWIAEE